MAGQIPGMGGGPVFQPPKPPPPTVAPFDDTQRGRGVWQADTSGPGGSAAARRTALFPAANGQSVTSSADLRDYFCTWAYPTAPIYPLLTFGAQVTPVSADLLPMTVEVQVSTSPLFVAPSTVTLVSQPSGVTTTATVGPFTNETYQYLRARAGDGVSVWSEWTPTYKVYVNSVSGNAVDYTYQNLGWLGDTITRDAVETTYLNHGFELPFVNNAWDYTYLNVGFELPLVNHGFEYTYLGDVNTDPPTPWLWTTVPTSGRVGDGLTVYGHGLGDNQAMYSGVMQMQIGASWENLSVLSWQRIAANANAATGARSIQPEAGIVDPEHNEIEVTVHPDAIPPGHIIRGQTTT